MDIEQARALVAEYQQAEAAWRNLDEWHEQNIYQGSRLWELEAGARRYAKLEPRDPRREVSHEEILESMLTLTFPDIGEALAVVAAHDGEAEAGGDGREPA